MQLRRASEPDRPVLAHFAATLQARPDRHVAYLGLDAASIAQEMVAEDDDWTAVTAVTEHEGRLVGWLMGSVDADMGRVWWFGPFVDAEGDEGWISVADLLYQQARPLLPEGVDEEELGVDARFAVLARWACERGFTADTGSAVLTLDGELAAPTIPIRPVTADDATSVGSLHEKLFAGTHTTGAALVAGADGTHLRLVAERGGEVVGYVAVERQADGDGYIDYVGVAEAARRQGLGAELIRAGVAALRPLGCQRINLTVRADNTGARALYAALGFTEERVISPLRLGFSLG